MILWFFDKLKIVFFLRFIQEKFIESEREILKMRENLREYKKEERIQKIFSLSHIKTLYHSPNFFFVLLFFPSLLAAFAKSLAINDIACSLETFPKLSESETL